jgi:DNA-damage-inducible protein J
VSKTASFFGRVEPEIKEQAEMVLSKLGIPMSNAINIFLRQVVLQNGLSFGKNYREWIFRHWRFNT